MLIYTVQIDNKQCSSPQSVGTLTWLDIKEASLGWLHKTLVRSGSDYFPRVQNSLQLTQAGLCEAREMLGLGTQEQRPWGLKHQATDNDVLYQSLFSKPIRGLGAWEKWLYHPCPSGAFSHPNLQTQTCKALRDAANITDKTESVVQSRNFTYL